MKHHQVNVGVEPRLFVCELWFNHSLDFRKFYISDFLLQLHKEWGGTTGLESCSPSPAASISDQLFGMPFRVRSKVVYWSNTKIFKLVHILMEMMMENLQWGHLWKYAELHSMDSLQLIFPSLSGFFLYQVCILCVDISVSLWWWRCSVEVVHIMKWFKIASLFKSICRWVLVLCHVIILLAQL